MTSVYSELYDYLYSISIEPEYAAFELHSYLEEQYPDLDIDELGLQVDYHVHREGMHLLGYEYTISLDEDYFAQVYPEYLI